MEGIGLRLLFGILGLYLGLIIVGIMKKNKPMLYGGLSGGSVVLLGLLFTIYFNYLSYSP